MADAREEHVWSQHARDCRDAGRKPFVFSKDDWFWQKSRWLKQLGCRTVLDFGCGPGYWSSLWKGFEYTGFDQNEEMIKLAKEVSPRLKFSNILENKWSDVVFTAGVLQHNVNHPDKGTCMLLISTNLKPGGYYFCTENTLPDGTPTDGYSFDRSGWINFVESYRFKLIETASHDRYLFQNIVV